MNTNQINYKSNKFSQIETYDMHIDMVWRSEF